MTETRASFVAASPVDLVPGRGFLVEQVRSPAADADVEVEDVGGAERVVGDVGEVPHGGEVGDVRGNRLGGQAVRAAGLDRFFFDFGCNWGKSCQQSLSMC